MDHFPKDIEAAVLNERNQEVALLNAVEVKLDPEVSHRMRGKHLPNGRSFEAAAGDAVEEVAALEDDRLHGKCFLLKNNVLKGLAKERLAAPGRYFAHQHTLLESRARVLVNVPEVPDIHAFFVQVVSQLRRREEVHAQRVNLYYHL